MRTLRIPLLLAALAVPALAQDDKLYAAGEVLDKELCSRMRDAVMPRIEAYTRMKFRRPIPVRIEPKGVWENKSKQKGFQGAAAKHALAYYTPGRNFITVVPWVIGRYASKNGPVHRTRDQWIGELEPTMIHELTHGIHHQNFYTEGRFYKASLRAGGLSEEELDRSTVDFLLGEGVPELVSLRTTEFPGRMERRPSRELPAALNYVRRYKPDGKNAYRLKLFATGYNDGLDLSYHIARLAGPRGIRAVLYRPPPRMLLFQPQILAKVKLDDPPEPDSIFGFLSTEAKIGGKEIRRAVNPGRGRYFEGAYRVPVRAKGCLIGYVATVGEAASPSGVGRYAFFVADPDQPRAPYIQEVVEGLKEINPGGTSEKNVDLPFAKGVKVHAVSVKADDGGQYMYAETRGLIVLAHESKPSSLLERRVLLALYDLYSKAPKKGLYDAAVEEAKAALRGG